MTAINHIKCDKNNQLYFDKTVYTLKSKLIPEIHNNIVRKKDKAGGIKLVYDKKTFKVRKFKILDTYVYIRISPKSTKETKIYFRPFKKSWSTKRNKLSKNKWGKPNNPLTNIWLELQFDHYDISRNTPLAKTEIEDHDFIRELRNNTNEFFTISNI